MFCKLFILEVLSFKLGRWEIRKVLKWAEKIVFNTLNCVEWKARRQSNSGELSWSDLSHDKRAQVARHHSPFLCRGLLQLSLCLSLFLCLLSVSSDLSGRVGWDQTWSSASSPGLSSSSGWQTSVQWRGQGQPAPGSYSAFLQDQVSRSTNINSNQGESVLAIQGQSREALCLIVLPLWTPDPGGRPEIKRKETEIIIEKVEGTAESQISEEAPTRTG